MKLYIIPGHGEGEEYYQWLIEKAKSKYDVVFLNLQMKEGNTFEDLISVKVDPDSTVFGFSCGALIAFKLKTPVKKGIYCSIANALEDDRKGGEADSIEDFGEALTAELPKIKYGVPSAEQFTIMCGDKEIFQRDKIFRKQFGVKEIPNTDHEFTDAYKKAVFEELALE